MSGGGQGASEYIFLPFLTFFLFAIVRVIMLRISIPLPQNFVVCLIGMLLAHFDILDLTVMTNIDPQVAIDIILPITMFMAGYYINMEVFQRPGLHILLFLVLTYGLSLSLMAMLVSKLVDWPWLDSAMLVCSSLPPGPILARTFLKRLTVSHKLETFMVGEALLSNVLSFFIFINLSIYGVKKEIKFEDLIHEILFGPLLGYVAAKIVSYWISRIIKDVVNIISIVIATVYFTFMLGELTKTSALLAIVVMGISMSGSHSSMEEQVEEVVFRILNVVANFYHCNLFVVVGINIYIHMDCCLNLQDGFNIILIFVMMAALRGAVVLMLSRLLHTRGFRLSANNLLVLWICNIRGSLSILMCSFIMLKGFPAVQPEKMFVYNLAQIALSLLLNTLISNVVIRYDILAQYDESRERFISTIMDILDSIRYRSLSANRHGNLSFADADWHTVAKFTELKHPLITLPATSTQAASISPEQEVGRSIRRILTIAKCSYRKQYQEGLMSRNAMRLLTQWTSRALAKGQNLIFPSKIASVLTIPTYYVFLIKNFRSRYHYLSTKESLCNAKSTFFVVFHFVDTVFTVLALANVLVADIKSRNFFFLIYNLAFVSVHFLWILVESLWKRKLDLWSTMIIPVVMFGMLDISIMQVVSSGSNIARVLRATCVLTRLLRPLRLAGMFLFTIKPMMSTCDQMISRRLMDGYDIGRSYIQARLEVVRLISHVEDVPPHLRENFKTSLTHHKIEAVKMLGIMQMHCPSTLTTAKTRQATRIVLKRQQYIVQNIKQSRSLGEDAVILEKIILMQMAAVNHSRVKISHPEYMDIIMNIPWIKDMSEVYQQVMDMGAQMKFKKHDIIVSQYKDPGGIFIILEGLAWVQRENRKRDSSDSVTMSTVDYLSTGSVIGEFTFLTGKPRHKMVGCYTDVMGLFVKSEFLYHMMGGKPDVTKPMFKLEEKMWRVVALRIALRLLMAEPSWLSWSQSQILMRLVDSVLVDGSDSQKSFNDWVNDYEIVLIQGKVMDLSSNEPLSAPAYIPRQRTTYTYMMKNDRRLLMLAIPPVEECDLHVATYDTPGNAQQLHQSESQCTFSSGSSNNPPGWQLRQPRATRFSDTYDTSTDIVSTSSRLDLSFGRRAFKSVTYPVASLLKGSFESPLGSFSRKGFKRSDSSSKQ